MISKSASKTGWWFQPLSQLGVFFSIYGKKNHVPNHQPGNGGRTRNRFFIIGPLLATTTTTGGIFTEDL